MVLALCVFIVCLLFDVSVFVVGGDVVAAVVVAAGFVCCCFCVVLFVLLLLMSCLFLTLASFSVVYCMLVDFCRSFACAAASGTLEAGGADEAGNDVEAGTAVCASLPAFSSGNSFAKRAARS